MILIFFWGYIRKKPKSRKRREKLLRQQKTNIILLKGICVMAGSKESYLVNCAMQVNGWRLLTVNTDYVSSSVDKIWNSLFGFNNHLKYFSFMLAQLLIFEHVWINKKTMEKNNTKCTSKGRSVTGRKASTTSGPIVIFGTKRPSITSTWIQSQPANSTAFT